MRSPTRPSRAALALIAASALAIPLLPATTTPAPAQASFGLSVSFGYFQDRLGRYGSWVQHPRWGEVWLPRGGAGFRPYYDGRWEYTSDVGWLWVSDDPWGEITDHYGRWVFDPGYGWLWVPGYVWGPSWVIWRQGDGYTGWFPMPPDYDTFDPYNYGPRYGADAWYGYRTWYPGFADTSFYSLWVFCDDRDFGFAGSRGYIADPFRIRDVYRRSVERTNYINDRNHIVDRSIDVRRLEQETHRRFDQQPARRFLANIPNTSITEGRDIARRNRDAFRNNGIDNFGRGNLGGGNLGTGNVAPGNTGGARGNPGGVRGQDQAQPPVNDQGRGFGRGFTGPARGNDNGLNRDAAPQGFVAPANNDNLGNPRGVRGQDQAQPPANDQGGRGFGRGFTGPGRGNGNGQTRDVAPQGFAAPGNNDVQANPGDRFRGNGPRGQALTNIPTPQAAPQVSAPIETPQPPGAGRGDNRPRFGGNPQGGDAAAPQGRGGRFGGGQVQGQLQAPSSQIQAVAPPQPAPQPQAETPTRGNRDATDRNDARQRGRGRGETP